MTASTSRPANPFATRASSLFGFAPLAAVAFAGAPKTSSRDSQAEADAIGPHTYALVKSGPEVDPAEVEVAGKTSVEVMVLWGTNVLHVDHLTPPRSYYVGEESSKELACDYLVPAEAIGASRAPLVVVRGTSILLVLLPGATGSVDIPGTGHATFEDLVSSGRARASSELAGAYEVELPAGASAKMDLERAGLGFRINTVRAGKAVPAGLLARLDPANGYVGLSLLLHATLAASVAMFMPHLGADDVNGEDRDQIVMMQHMLSASAAHEEEAKQIEQNANVDSSDSSGGTGAQAKGAEGTMGNRLSTATGNRYSVQGPHDNTDPHLARLQALQEAREFGMIGIVSAGAFGSANAPVAPWGRDEALGTDDRSFNGNMWGNTLGDAFGQGGLGLFGLEEGGGGKAEGVGLEDGIGTIGHGHGGDDQGIGRDHGRLNGGYQPHHGPTVRQLETTVNGRLPAEVIQRIVRQNFGRFRMCYETASAATRRSRAAWASSSPSTATAMSRWRRTRARICPTSRS
jgi:hypothetical protein